MGATRHGWGGGDDLLQVDGGTGPVGAERRAVGVAVVTLCKR